MCESGGRREGCACLRGGGRRGGCACVRGEMHGCSYMMDTNCAHLHRFILISPGTIRAEA